MKKIMWDKVKSGESYSAESAPDVAGKPFKIRCRITGDRTGVVIAHGGHILGYSLYVADSKVTFAVRTAKNSIRRVVLPSSGDANEIQAAMEFNGTLRLDVDGEKATTEASKGSGLIGGQPREPLSIGYDTQNPVDAEAPKLRFKGRIESLGVSAK